MKSRKGVFELATGREIKANRGILGISADGSRDLFQGYDGEVEIFDPDVDRREPLLTQAEREEISAFMVELWEKWAKPV